MDGSELVMKFGLDDWPQVLRLIISGVGSPAFGVC